MSKREEQSVDFEKICRLCLAEKRSMSSIFPSKEIADSRVPLHQRIMTCASVVLYEGDGLPGQICSKCLLAVNQSYALREQVEAADAQLREMLQKLTQPSEDAVATTTPSVDEVSTADANGQPPSSECEVVILDVKDALPPSSPVPEPESAFDLLAVLSKHPGITVTRKRVDGKNEVVQCKDDHDQSPIRVLNEGKYSGDNKPRPHKRKKKTAIKEECDKVNCENVDRDLVKVEETELITHPDVIIRRKSFSCEEDGAEDGVNDDECCLMDVSQVKKEQPEELANGLSEMEVVFQEMILTPEFFGDISEMRRNTEMRRQEINRKVKECALETGDGRIYCKECKIFIRRAYFYNHIKFGKRHANLRDYLCQQCGYRAQTGHILRVHIESVHSGSRFDCKHCDKSFSCRKRHDLHVRKFHSNSGPIARPFICQFCGKAFTSQHTLRNHIRTHTQETPYKCQYCDRRFSFRWPCKTHERLHTGVKPYKCSFCSEAFTQNCVRKNHEYRAHGNEEFNPKNRKPREGNKREKKAKKVKEKIPEEIESTNVETEIVECDVSAEINGEA